MEPEHYLRPRHGLKSASLLDPHWLFRCIRKDPVRHLLPCPDVTPAGFSAFPGACAELRRAPPKVSHPFQAAGGTRVSRDTAALAATDASRRTGPPFSSQCSPEGIPPAIFLPALEKSRDGKVMTKHFPLCPLSYGSAFGGPGGTRTRDLAF